MAGIFQLCASLSRILGILGLVLAVFFAIAAIRIDNRYASTLVLNQSLTDHFRAKVVEHGFQYTGTCKKVKHNTSCSAGESADSVCHHVSRLMSMTKLLSRRLHGSDASYEYCIDTFMPWLLVEFNDDGRLLHRCVIPLASFTTGPMFSGYSFKNAVGFMPDNPVKEVTIWATADKQRCVLGFTSSSSEAQLEQLDMQMETLLASRGWKRYFASLSGSMGAILLVAALTYQVCSKPPAGYEAVTTEEYQ